MRKSATSTHCQGDNWVLKKQFEEEELTLADSLSLVLLSQCNCKVNQKPKKFNLALLS